MATRPTPRTLSAILESLRKVFTAESGVNDYNKGSAIDRILKTAAISDFRSQSDIIAVLSVNDIDRSVGLDLDNIGIKAKVKRPQSKAATGTVTAKSLTFTKISTKVYAGAAAPAIGSTTINIASSDDFPATGSIYIGRGSNNYEGPIPYMLITPVGNYYQLSLSNPTTKNHNIGESVILAQGGNRSINAGSIVQTRGNVTNLPVKFRILNTAIIPDGEDHLSGIPVLCTEIGSIGSVAAGSIAEFATNPFPGASVLNELPFVTGRDKMSDPDYRLLIKNTEQSRVKGTDLAIKTAAIDVTSTDDNKTVTSAEIKKPANREEPSILYIDDSTGYEPIFSGQGFEQVVDAANGGEKNLKLQHEDLTKALVVTSFNSPYTLTGAMELSVLVGGQLSSHVFLSTDFVTQNAADSYEVVNSINSNTSLLFSAKVIDNGKKILLFAKNFKNEDIQLTSTSLVNANNFLGFTENLTYSLRLYKDDVLLNKDGIVPSVYTKPQSAWTAGMVDGDTLIIKVDGSKAATYTFNDSDFVPYGYPTVSYLNPLASWANVFNDIVPGIFAEVEGNVIKISSNKGADNEAKIAISGGTLFSKMFGPIELSATGISKDYSLNRATGQVQLVNPLVKGSNVTAGSKNTRAFIDSSAAQTGSVTIGASPDPMLFLLTDSVAEFIPNLADGGVSIEISNSFANTWRFTTSINAFPNVEIGDWVVIAEDAIISHEPNFLGYFRVSDCGADFFEIKITDSLATAHAGLLLTGDDKISFIRSAGDIQPVVFPDGLNTLSYISSQINSQLIGCSSSVVGGKVFRLTSNSYSLNSYLMICGFTSSLDSLGLPLGGYDYGTINHVAFAESTSSDKTIPVFFHDQVALGDTGPVFEFQSTQSVDEALDSNDKITFLDPYDGSKSSNKDITSQINHRSGTDIGLDFNAKMNDIILNDRFYGSKPFDFKHDDNLVIILDGDAINKTLTIRMSRKGIVNNQFLTTPTQTMFRAYDGDAGATANFADQFGDDFNFYNFKAHFRARQIVDPTDVENKFLLRATDFGPNGERVRFGIFYPVASNNSLGSTVSVGKYTDIRLYLASGSQRLGGTWDGTTEFEVTDMGGNIFRYVYTGVGSAPNFVAVFFIGDSINIDFNSGFDKNNTGMFICQQVQSTYFEVYNPHGVDQSGAGAVIINAPSSISAYDLNSAENVASNVIDYINSNLSVYLTAEALDSSIGEIRTSTYDDQSGSSGFVHLVDAENWIESSDIGTVIAPENVFYLKQPLLIQESDPEYSLVGEEFYLIPTTSEQIKRFLNIFAVTGLSSLGVLQVSDNASKIQISSTLFGSKGSVLVTGGSANEAAGAVLISGSILAQSVVNKSKITSTTVYIDTSEPHNLVVNEIVMVDLPDLFHEDLTVSAVSKMKVELARTTIMPAILTAVRTSNVSTYTTSLDHGLTTGQVVEISGCTDNSFDGIYTVTATPTSDSFEVSQINPDTSTSGGTVISIQSLNGSILLPYIKFSVDESSRYGLQVGQWVLIENTSKLPKTLGFSSNTELRIQAINTLELNPSFNGTFKIQKSHSADNSTVMMVEKQGQFICISHASGTAPSFDIEEGDRVEISGAFNINNTGIFKVMKVFGDSFYIMNEYPFEELVTLSAASDIKVYTYDSVMPGDVLSIESDILGSSNKNQYVVQSSTVTSLVVSPNFSSLISYTALGSDYTNVRIIEKDAYMAFSKLVNISQDPQNEQQYQVVVDSKYLPGKITSSAGSGILSMSKFGFSTTVQTGEDSYKYYNGLIRAVGRVIRGLATDPITYPGVAASGSYIEIDAALQKRIQISIVVRNRTGIPFSTIKSRVQTTVSSYINALGVGEPVVFSRVISLVQELSGIQAVSISSPTYNATNDQIISQENEKPIVKNLNEDIVVSLAT